MSIYLYREGESPVHRLHPVTKILGLVFSFIACMLIIHPVSFFPFLSFVLLVGVISGSLGNLKRVWPFMLVLFVFTFLIWCVFYGGQETIFLWGRLRITRESILYGLGMALRLDLLFLLGLIFLSTTRVEEFTAGLQWLGLPYTFGFALSLAFRMVPVFMESAFTIVQAQKSRGLDFRRGNLIQRLRRYLPVIIPVFMTALRKADGMAVALESRGFRPDMHRRRPCVHYPFGWQDGIAMAVSVSFVLLHGWFLRWGVGNIS